MAKKKTQRSKAPSPKNQSRKPAPAKKPEPKKSATKKKIVTKTKQSKQKAKKPAKSKPQSKKKQAPVSKGKKLHKKEKKAAPSKKGKKNKNKPKQKSGKKSNKANPKTKKRSGAKRKGKKKNRGSTDYQKIKKYLLERYKRRCNIVTDKDASQTATNIYKWLKINGKFKNKKHVTHKLLKEALNELFPQEQRRFGRRIVPDIPDFAQQPQEFYNIEDVIRDMDKGLYNRVWIYSPLILGKRNNGYVFLSPTRKHTYEETFQAWVDWCNEQIRDGNYKEGSPPDIWYRFLDVFWNSRKKRWEVKIIPCDVDGDCLNTGFIPTEDCDTDETEERYGVNPDDVAKEKQAQEEAEKLAKDAEAAAKKKGEELPAEPKTSEPVQEAKEVTQAKQRTEVERQKAWRIQTLIKAKQSIMEDIKFNKDMGEPYDDLMVKLKKVREQIDLLLEEK